MTTNDERKEFEKFVDTLKLRHGKVVTVMTVCSKCEKTVKSYETILTPLDAGYKTADDGGLVIEFDGHGCCF